jgi:hypothetical protein
MASLAFLRFAVERLINGSADKAERDALLEAVENGNLIFARGERAVAVGGSVHGAIVTGNNNLVLSLDETNVEILRRTLSALFAASAAGSQPPLDLPVLDPNEQNRFVYGAQRIPFIGRAADLGACGDFLKNEGLFRWWLLLGSGGAGKSRLALELCLRMQDGWRTGFLPHRHGFVGWSSWQPEKPTLLVADYAGERAGDVRDLIVALAGRRNLAFPVRLLLLERENVGPWWREIMRGGQEQAVIEAAQFAEPRQLLPMNSDDLWRAMSAMFGERRGEFEDRRGEILTKLHEIDPRGLPLFAALAADALLHGGDIFRWDRKVLVRDLLTREDRRRWEPAGVGEDDPHRTLLALSTALGGLRRGDLTRSDVSRMVPAAQFRPRIYQILTGRPIESRVGTDEDAVLPGLEPDIVGELFVLEHLASRRDALDDFRQAAWAIDPYRFSTFLDRATRDFDAHPTIKSLLEPNDDDAEKRLYWGRVTPSVVAKMIEAGDGPGALATLESLLARAQGEMPGSVVVPGPLAFAATTVAKHFVGQGNGTVAQSIHAEIAALAKQYLHFTELGEAQLSIAFKLIEYYGKEEEYASILPLYRSAISLRATREACVAELGKASFPEIKDELNVYGYIERTGGPPIGLQILQAEEEEFRLKCARLGVNSLRWVGKSGNLSGAREIFDEISLLAASHSRQIALKDAVAAAAVNLALHYGHAGNLEEAEKLLDLLHRDADVAYASDNIRNSFGKAVVNVVQDYKSAGRLDAASAHYEALAQLAGTRPAQSELQSYQAMALEVLVEGASAAGDVTKASPWLAELVALAERHPGDRTFREPLIHATRQVVRDFCTAGRASEAYEAYRNCAEVLKNDVASRAAVADLGQLLVVSLYRAGDPTFVAQIVPALAARSGTNEGSLEDRKRALLLEALEKLALGGEVEVARKVYGDLSGLAEARGRGDTPILAAGLSSLLLGACLIGDGQTATQFYGEFHRLAARSGHEVDLSTHQALMAHNMLILAEKTADAAAAATYYDDLRAATAAGPQDADRKRCLADAALRAQLMAIQAGDRTKGKAIHSDLAALAREADGDREITRLLSRATYNVVVIYGQEGDLPRANAARCELTALLDSQDEPDLREDYAKATFNVLTESAARDGWELASECYAKLRSLAEHHPDEAVLQVEQGKGAHDLSCTG